jgi:hypothetical protein
VRWPLSLSTARASSTGSLAGCQDHGKQITRMDRSLLRRLETGYRLSKAALVVEISRSQSCFVVESDFGDNSIANSNNWHLFLFLICFHRLHLDHISRFSALCHRNPIVVAHAVTSHGSSPCLSDFQYLM